MILSITSSFWELAVKNIIKRRLDYAEFCNHRKM